MSYMNIVQPAAKGILLRRARVIGNLYAGLVLSSVMIDINVGAFIKAVVIW